MKILKLLVSLSLFLFLGQAQAQNLSSEQIENRVRTDIESSLSKLVSPFQYVVQVGANVDRTNERQVVEGEQFVQSLGGPAPKNIPPLPGFDPPVVEAAPQPPSQTRQVFKMVEKSSLKNLSVNLILDSKLKDGTRKMAEEVVRSYLQNQYANRFTLNLQKADLKDNEASLAGNGVWDNSRIIWALLLIFGIGLLFIFYKFLNRLETAKRNNDLYPMPYRDVEALPKEREKIGGPQRDGLVPILPPVEKNRERAAFSGIPVNSGYADHRKELLNQFLEHSAVFRLYFEKLDSFARAELCVALVGPAFSTLVESLKMKIPDLTDVTPPSEEQLQFFLKNFAEFHEAFDWQNEQFFGFLLHLSEEQLVSLVQSQNPLVSAIVLNFIRAEGSAAVFEKLSDKERMNIVEQFSRAQEISPAELKDIEMAVRSSVQQLPKFIFGNSKLEVDYWSRLLTVANDPEKILSSIEKTRPDLYEKLARFRFKIYDIPSLPNPLVRKVLDELENDDLARALSQQSQDLVDYTLQTFPDGRKKLIENQIISHRNGDPAEIQKSVQLLTRRFREVLL